MDDNTAVFKLTVFDIQLIAEEELNRPLTQEEMEIVKDTLEDYLEWYDKTVTCIRQEL